MENTTHSRFTKLMSFVFIALGVFLGIYAFFVNATTWTIGSITWDNANYISESFRNENPTDYDIITALYGTGDEGSVYTENWTGYNSGSCLNNPMSIVRTGVIPSTIDPYTIYVIASGTYAISSTIQMNTCSALISSGDVILQSISSPNTVLSISGIHYTIIDNIDINGNGYDSIYGISIFSGHSNTLHAIKSTYSSEYGIYINKTTYNSFSEIISSHNRLDGIRSSQSAYNTFINITGANSMYGYGLYISSSGNNILNNISVFGNRLYGLSLNQSDYNTGTNLIVYANGGTTQGGIEINSSNNNNLFHLHLYNNTICGLQIYNSTGNEIIDVNTHENRWGIHIDTSDYNILSGITASGNLNNGIHIEYSTNNYLYNIHSHDNTHGGLQINTSPNNDFEHIFSYDNNNFGISINTGDNNSFTDIESYDNTEHNLSINNSNSNTFMDITANGSENAIGVYVANSSGNILSGVQAYGNYYAGIHFYKSHNNTGTAIVSNSNEGGLYMENSTWNFIENTIIENNTKNGVMFVSGSNNNTITGVTISGNMGYGIFGSMINDITISNSYIHENLSGGLIVSTGNNNTFQDIQVYNNTGFGISMEYISGTFITNTQIYNNTTIDPSYGQGIGLSYSTGAIILNCYIESDKNTGIHIRKGHGNIISGTILSGTNGGMSSISFHEAFNNIIYNSFSNTSYYSFWGGDGGTNNTFTLFSGNKPINVIVYSGLGSTNIDNPIDYTFDAYTKINNYIVFVANPYMTLTGILTIGGLYYPDFNEIHFQESTYNNELIISGAISFTISGDTWDGKIYSPNSISGPKAATATETGITQISSILDTIEVISGSTYLTMNEGIGTIFYEVSTGTSGQYLKIFKSNNGDTWTSNTTQSGCILDEYKICEFNFTGDIKLFAFGVPGLLFTGTTLSGDSVISGGIYNTGVIITYSNPNLSGATLNGNPYTSGNQILLDGDYVFFMEDLYGNSTGITFTIDTTGPTLTGADNNEHYNTDITITGSDIHGFSGFDFSGSFYTGESLLITGEGTYILTGYDSLRNATSITFTIDKTNPLVMGNTPATGAYFTGTNIYFSRVGSDTFGIQNYTLYISGMAPVSLGTATSYTGSLANGIYDRYVVATDLAGNNGASAPATFTINAPLLPTITMLTGNLLYNVAWYTNDYISIQLRSNKLANYSLTGDITTPLYGSITGNAQIQFNPSLSGSDGNKTIYLQVTDGITTTGASFTIRLDSSAPSLPTLISPINGAVVENVFTLDWSDSLDAGVGTSGFRYFIYSTGIYAGLVKSGYTDAIVTYANIAHGELGPNGTYYRYVSPVDKLGNSGSTAMQYFVYSGGVIDTIPDQFTFEDEENADLDEIYDSNIIMITGMTPNVPVLATITNGALLISGTMVGTTGYVQNGWTVQIELISSNDYDETVSSTLTINGVSDTFSVTTKKENDNMEDYEDIDTYLSNSQKLMIITVFETLKDLYAGNKEKEFLETLMVMLKNNMDDYDENDDEYIALKYLFDIVEQYYDNGNFGQEDIDEVSWIKDGIYRAPNGKVYHITYDSSKQRFTSPDFVTPKYFTTLDTLKYIIDINNPIGSKYSTSKAILARWKNAAIDGTRQTSPYTAPNGKVFYFFKDITERYSSYTFTSERYFNSLNEVKEFIYNTNR